MPLETQIKRNGRSRPIRWGEFHVAAMVLAVTIDSGEGPFEDNVAVQQEAKDLMERQGHIGISPKMTFDLSMYHVIGATPLNDAPYTMENVDLVFHDNMDGEKFEIKVGDELSMWRSM